ncbi:MAG TPA: hypothetical protein VHO70_24130, partial [Chitinispirillaceae bacterium]|nr:hypothetical protein [Chitinispirillaceae bacterium]
CSQSRYLYTENTISTMKKTYVVKNYNVFLEFLQYVAIMSSMETPQFLPIIRRYTMVKANCENSRVKFIPAIF